MPVAAEPLGRAGGERRAVAAGHDVAGGDALRGHALGVLARAGRQHALRADEHRDQHDRRRQRGAAPPVGGQAGAGQQPRAPSARSGAASAAAGSPSSQRPSSATPAASRMPARIENADACSPLNSTPSRRRRPSASTPAACARRRGGRARSPPRAAPRRGGPCRRGAPPRPRRAARCRRPSPSAAASGIHECPGAKPAGTSPWSARQVDQRVGERPAGEQAERAGDERDEQRLGRRSAAGPGAAWRRARAAPRSPAGAGRSRARTSRRPRTAPRRRRCRPSCRRSRSARAVGRPRVAGVGVGRVGAVEHLDAGRSEPRASCGASAGCATTPTALTLPGAPESRVGGGGGEEHRGLAAVRLAAPRAMPVTR